VGAGVDPNELLSPAARAALPAADLTLLQAALVSALHSVYLLFAAVAVLGVLVAAFMPGGPPSGAAESTTTRAQPQPRPVAVASD